jgi:flagellar assembly factor FliW
MKCVTTRFGTFDIKDEAGLTFPSGLLGFPDRRRYVILDHDTDAPFKWLQSLDDPALAFVIIDPTLFHPAYRVEISPEALAEIQGGKEDELTTAVILTIPSDDPSRITANLRGPLLMNPRTRLCKQLVLPEEFPTRYPLFPATASVPSASERPAPAAECPV